MTARVDALLAQGALQISSKYRRVFVFPDDPLAWVEHNHPDVYKDIMRRALYEARRFAYHFHKEGIHELTPAEFREFREKKLARKEDPSGLWPNG